MGCHAHSCVSRIKHDCPKVGFNEFSANRQINIAFFLLTSQHSPTPAGFSGFLAPRGIYLSPGPLASPSQLWKPGWQRGMAQVPSLCVFYFHLSVPSPWAAWPFPGSCVGSSPELGRSARGGDSACVYKFLGQGEVTAVRAGFSHAGPGIATSLLSEEHGGGVIWIPVVHGFGDRDITLILAEDLCFSQY